MMVDIIDMVAGARSQLDKGDSEEEAEGKMGSVVLLVCCEGSVCAMTQSEDRWVELRSRSDLYTGNDMEPVLPIIQPLIDAAGADAEILFANDEVGSGFAEYLQQQLPNNTITEVTRLNHLWNILRDQ